MAVGAEACDGDDLRGSTCLDLGFYEPGPVTCRADCTFDDSACVGYCGDGVRNGPEACDGDDLGGADCSVLDYYRPEGLACTSVCTFNGSACSETCGDGIVNGPELCDGDVPALVCTEAGFDYGKPTCSAACGADLSSCGQIGWVAEPIDQEGYIVGDLATADGRWYALDLAKPGRILEWQGSEWVTIVSEFRGQEGIWIGPGTDLFGVGPDYVTRFDLEAAGGPTYEEQRFSAARLNSVSGVSSSEIYAAGETALFSSVGVVARFDGSDWNVIDTGLSIDSLRDVHAVGPSNVWAVGDGGTVIHLDGTTWEDVTPDVAALVDFSGVWSDGTEVFAVGADELHHFDGSDWSSYTAPDVDFRDVVGLSATSVFAVGQDTDGLGTVWHFDGVSWVHHDTSDVGGTAYYAVEVAGTDEVRLGGRTLTDFTAVLRYVGAAWREVIDMPDTVTLSALWAYSRDEFLAAGRDGIPRSIFEIVGGEVVSTVDISGFLAGTNEVRAFWVGPGANDVWAVSGGSANGEVLRRVGGTWGVVDAGVTAKLASVWGSGSQVFVGGQSVVYQLDGTWKPWSIGGGGMVKGLWGPSPDSVYAATANGHIYHFDGSGWERIYTVAAQSSGRPQPLVGLWGAGENEIYAVTDRGVVVKFDGAEWTEREAQGLYTGLAIAGTGSGDVVAFGGYGGLSRNLGTGWAPVGHPNIELSNLFAVGPRYILTGTTSQIRILLRDFGNLVPP